MSGINRVLMYCLFWAIVAFFAPTIIKYLLLAASAVIYILFFNLNPPRERQSRDDMVWPAKFTAWSRPPPRSAATSDFHRFMDLPVELRDCIWEFAELDLKPKRILIPLKRSKSDPARPVVPAPPALMHACRESRQLLQKHYSSLCCTGATSTPVKGSLDPFVWINYDRDIFHADMVAMRNLVSPEFRLHVGRLDLVFNPGYSVSIFSERDHIRLVSDFVNNFGFVHSFPRLRDVHLSLMVPSPVEGPDQALKPWQALAFSILTELYATCTPVDFDLTIHGPDDSCLFHDDFLNRLQQVSDLFIRWFPPQVYPLFQRWFTFDNFSDRRRGIWKHVGCDCQDDSIHDDQRKWVFRTKGVK